MAETNPTDCDRDPAHPSADDAKAERVALAFLLGEHPSLLTIPELSRALNADPGFDTDDPVERAVRELVALGSSTARVPSSSRLAPRSTSRSWRRTDGGGTDGR